MTKSIKDKKTVYKSFEQFKADLFPSATHKINAASNEDISNLAVCLAETSFNKVLHPDEKA